jgi:hypothetical protein
MASSILLLAGFLWLGLWPGAASGQSNGPEKPGPKPVPYALIFGTVWDPDGHPLYGVKVKIRRSDEKKTRWEQYSNHIGEFAQRVPVDKADYVVWADTKGYKSASGKRLKPGTEVSVHVDGDGRSDVGLHLDWE